MFSSVLLGHLSALSHCFSGLLYHLAATSDFSIERLSNCGSCTLTALPHCSSALFYHLEPSSGFSLRSVGYWNLSILSPICFSTLLDDLDVSLGFSSGSLLHFRFQASYGRLPEVRRMQVYRGQRRYLTSYCEKDKLTGKQNRCRSRKNNYEGAEFAVNYWNASNIH